MTEPITCKKTNIPWMPEIPEHWEIWKMSRAVRSIGSGTTPSTSRKDYYDNGTIDWLNTGDFNNGVLNTTKKKITIKALNEILTLKTFPKGTLSVAMYGATIGKVCLVNFETTTNQACCNLPQEEVIYNTFLMYWFIGNKKHIIRLSYGGGQPNISQNTIKTLRIPIPKLSEQTAIANYLDYKLEKIDRFITKKKQLIKLLTEQKAAIINQAVTKGINPNAKLKSSGIEWLGDIPEHWEVRKLKELCVGFGRIGFRGYKTTDLVDEGEGAITISPSNIKSSYMTFEKCTFLSWEKYEQSPEIKVYNDDIIMVKTGSTFGKVGLVKNLTEKATINPQLLVLKNININPNYLYHLLKSEMVKKQVNFNVIGSTIPTISQSKILNFKLVLPPESEINYVFNYLESETNIIEKTISAIEKEIGLVEEYKTALIAEAVTGKIDVRDYKVPNVEEPLAMVAEEATNYKKTN